VLQERVHVAVVVDLELAGGVVVELVGQAESRLDDLLLPVEGELGAHGLRGRGCVVDEQEELAELQLLLVYRFVLEANEGVACGVP